MSQGDKPMPPAHIAEAGPALMMQMESPVGIPGVDQ